MAFDSSLRFLRRPRFPKELLKERQQVAAVCYRMGKRGIEFLLVQTRNGRWIFPKGGVESGLTHAQSAALEAIEEAGVHGRMEEIPFARYFRSNRDVDRSAEPASEPKLAVATHLCEVTRLEPPQETNRNPTWFSAEKAKQRLRKDRAPEFGAELARIIDRALSRIQRLQASVRRNPDRRYKDGLQEVRFEAFGYGRFHGDFREAVFARYALRQRNEHSSAAIDVAVQAHVRRLQQVGAPAELGRSVLRLGAGAVASADTPNNITSIDGGKAQVGSRVVGRKKKG